MSVCVEDFEGQVGPGDLKEKSLVLASCFQQPQFWTQFGRRKKKKEPKKNSLFTYIGQIFRRLLLLLLLSGGAGDIRSSFAICSRRRIGAVRTFTALPRRRFWFSGAAGSFRSRVIGNGGRPLLSRGSHDRRRAPNWRVGVGKWDEAKIEKWQLQKRISYTARKKLW